MSNNQPRFGGMMGPGHGRSLSSSAQQSSHSFDNFQSPLGSNAPTSTGATPLSTKREEYTIDDGDVAMEDADPYNRMKYPSRPNHSHQRSQHLPSEESSAARRYSPTSPYPANSPQQPNHTYNAYTPNNQSARQSPNRGNPYATPSNQYYPSSCKFLLTRKK
jgi:dual specificity protein kinase YAK1